MPANADKLTHESHKVVEKTREIIENLIVYCAN